MAHDKVSVAAFLVHPCTHSAHEGVQVAAASQRLLDSHHQPAACVCRNAQLLDICIRSRPGRLPDIFAIAAGAALQTQILRVVVTSSCFHGVSTVLCLECSLLSHCTLAMICSISSQPRPRIMGLASQLLELLLHKSGGRDVMQPRRVSSAPPLKLSLLVQ
jgi:hypothetical protein